MSMKEWISLAKNKAHIAIIGLKMAGIGFVLGITIMNIVRKFKKEQD